MPEEHTIPTWSLLHAWTDTDLRRPILAIVTAPDPAGARHLAEDIYTIDVGGQPRRVFGDLAHCIAVFRGDISATLTTDTDTAVDVLRMNTDTAPHVAAIGCDCPPDCPYCDATIDTAHDFGCLWQPGTLAHQPCPAMPMVTTGHTHRPGCRHVQAHPGALFIPAVQCSFCGAFNTCESDSFPSFGGTTEGYERCTGCGQRWGWADLTAIV